MGNQNYVKIVVIVTAATSEHRLSGPWLEKEQAEKDLAKIRASQQNVELIDLPWLSVSGAQVLAAHLTDRE